MQGASVAAVLERADSGSLPLLGGMARPNGVVIASERFFAFAGRDGSLLEGDMPEVPALFRRIPLIRGLAKLSLSVSPLLGRDGVAGRRERLLLTGALLAPMFFVFLSGAAALVAGFVMTGVLLCWLLRGRTLFLHGAEHRAIAAAEEGTLGATWRGETAPSRFSLRCGTNFVALVLPVGLVADRLSMELWRVVQGSTLPAARVFLMPGLALQRLTTREPTLDETRLALTAVASVVRRETETAA